MEPEHLALVALRDLDEPEREHIRKWKLNATTMRAIDERGIRAVMLDAIERASTQTAGIWLSLDMDCLDPETAPLQERTSLDEVPMPERDLVARDRNRYHCLLFKPNLLNFLA